MAQASCRVTPALDDALDAAADETGLFRSDLMRRAVIHYIHTNPDGLQAFSGEDVPQGVRPPRKSSKGQTYDPTTDL